MFTCARVSDVEYYLAEADAAAEQGQDNPNRRDSAGYYLDNGVGEDKGVWWTLKGNAKREPGSLAKHGHEVEPWAFRALSRGVDPWTKEPLIQTNSPKRMAAYDMQFAAPKSVSVLWATGTPEQRAKMEAIHQKAVAAALDGIKDAGLIITRRGKEGTEKEVVADAAVAMFMHTSSRAGDPQLHTHAVLTNVCRRADGTYGTLDNARILQYQGYVGAMYRSELAKGIEEELGLSISRDERAFRVDGVPDTITELFSKRRAAIEDAAKEAGYTTGSSPERARLAAVATRDRKSDVPERGELDKRWARELASAGWSEAAVWASAEARARFVNEAAFSHGITKEEWRADELRRAGVAAIETLEAHNAVFERRHLLCEIQERMQGVGGIEDAKRVLAKLEEDGLLMRVGTLREGKPYRPTGKASITDEPAYATPAMVRTEHELLRAAKARKGEREFVPAELVEAAIKRREGISDEQAAAVRHALNRDGVSVVEGSAGTGKSYSLGGVADAAREAGLHVFVIAPSHKAKEVARHDTTTDEDSAKAVAGFLRRLDTRHRKHIALTSRDCIILDEAGMVGTKDMAVLLKHAEAAGAKVILAGDTRQLQPVTAGSPMGGIAKTCGTQRLETIRRQSKEWQRAASNDFATGHANRALEAYAEKKRLAIGWTQEEAVSALAGDWRRDVERNPEAAMGKPWEARLVVAGRNKDVRMLNEVLRAQYREAGRLEGDDVALQAFSRGANGKVEPLSLAVGDRLIFGEAAKVRDVEVNNSDMGTVEAVQVAEDGDHLVRVRLDKGTVLEGKWSEFVGFREQDAPASERHPKVQHAYAVTVHASQGTTVDRCYAYNGHGMGMESAYVAMTRHRVDAKMYVDGSRIVDRLEARRSKKDFRISKSGKETDTADEGEALEVEDGKEITLDMVKAIVTGHEVMRSETKQNVLDFLEEPAEWLKDEDPMGAVRKGSTPEVAGPRLPGQPEAAEEPPPPIPHEDDAYWESRAAEQDDGPPAPEGWDDQGRDDGPPGYDDGPQEYDGPQGYDDGYDMPPQEAEHVMEQVDAMVAEGAAAPRHRPLPSFVVKHQQEKAKAATAAEQAVQAPAVPPSDEGSRGEVMVKRAPLPVPSIVLRLQEERARAAAAQPPGPVALVAAPSPPAQPRDEKAVALEKRMASRREGPAYPARTGPTTGIRGLSPSDELEVFGREIDLVKFLESRGYRENRAESSKRMKRMEYGSSKMNVSIREGFWVWSEPNGNSGGGIVSYLQKVENAGSLGQVRKQLRAYMGESTDPRDAPAPRAPVAAPVQVREFDFPRIRRNWQGMDTAPNAWLQEARGIRPEVLARFQADIRTEGKGSKQNPGGACFAHRDEAGEIVGYQRKGPRPTPDAKRSFSQWSSGGEKAITRMGDTQDPQVIYVGETAIDVLSVYQHDGQPRRALLCAVDGSTSAEARDEVAKLAVKHPHARILLAFDNDLPKETISPHTGEVRIIPPAGDVQADKMEEAIRARAPEARMERYFPHPDFKDWNDCILGKPRAEQDRADREREQREKAQQQAQENRLRAQGLTNRISLASHELREGVLAGEVSPQQEYKVRAEIRSMQQELAALQPKGEDGSQALQEALRQQQREEEERAAATPGMRR